MSLYSFLTKPHNCRLCVQFDTFKVRQLSVYLPACLSVVCSSVFVCRDIRCVFDCLSAGKSVYLSRAFLHLPAVCLFSSVSNIFISYS